MTGLFFAAAAVLGLAAGLIAWDTWKSRQRRERGR